jgi:16S rRNA (guanine1207-N2)-methyltransferase
MQNPAESLLLEYLQPTTEAHILILEGGAGWLAAEAIQKTPDGKVLSLTRDIREVWAAETRLEAIPNASATQDVFPTSAGWDLVLLPIPKGRRYTRRLLLAAWEALKPGGRLLLAGPSKGGAKAVIKDAARLFGNATVLGYRQHQRVAACTRGESFPDPLPKEFQQNGVAPGTRHFVEIQRPEGTLKLETHPGIFSWEALDEGTALLLEHLKIEPGSRVWDVGCGYGAIGLSAALAGAELVAMSDVNLIGVGYAQTNALRNRLDHKVKVFPADTLSTPHFTPSTDHFDLIVSNPAFHQGRAVDKSMSGNLITQAPDFLAPGGRLVIVANRFLNYDKTMQEYFAQVERVAETGKFHVIEARK